MLRTLIRCYFSPASTTNNRYIYSGSADGRIHVRALPNQIWSLDGQVVQVIDRNETYPLYTNHGEVTDPSGAAWSMPHAIPVSEPASSRTSAAYGRSQNMCIVRDVSWHPSEPTLMSTAWDGVGGQTGSIAQHVRRTTHPGMARRREAVDDVVIASTWSISSICRNTPCLSDADAVCTACGRAAARRAHAPYVVASL